MKSQIYTKMNKSFNKIIILPTSLILIFLSCKSNSIDSTHVNEELQNVKNIIFMIGDGMGLSQVSACAAQQDFKSLYLERAEYIGIAKTYSLSDKVTDSAAAGTALATGSKTYNSAIGVDNDKKPLESILKKFQKKGLGTGIVVTHALVDATPAAFVSNVSHRDMKEDIALDFYKSGIDIAIGGGKKFFQNRSDGKKLIDSLQSKGYHVFDEVSDIDKLDKNKVFGLLAEEDMPSIIGGRGNYLAKATNKTLSLLNKNYKNGFFLMVEGSMIDRGGHKKDIEMVTTETLDFDESIRIAFDFADKNPGTLVVVTADHETGGLSLTKSSSRDIKYQFSTGSHTATFVPIYAYGAGAKKFSTVMENTDIPKIMESLLFH